MKKIFLYGIIATIFGIGNIACSNSDEYIPNTPDEVEKVIYSELFSDSIKNNIAFGNGKTDMATVQQYAAYASIHDEITQFREGYDTLVGERGVTLSGGQKQRISIARAFLKDAPVIILDDCLSAVDTNTEKRIMSNMRDYLDNKTAIFITHRIFSLISFDKIIVLDNHTVAEFGTHDELMEKRGLYYQMFESQRQETVTS